MHSLNRRAFLGTLSAVAAAGFVGTEIDSSLARAAKEPHLNFPTAPRDRISLTSYPFRAYIETPANHARDPRLPGMTLEQFAALAALKFNVHHIEPHGRHFRSLDSAYLKSVREAFEKVRVDVVDLAAPDLRLYDSDASVRKEAVAGAKKWVDAAVAIGVPSVQAHIRHR